MSKSSIQLVENELIEVREEDSISWYVARIQKLENRRILVHYLNWHKRHDQWLPARSPRIRALSKENASKLPEDQNKIVMFKVGEAIEAKWIDRHYYPGTIQSVVGNEHYRVLFSDGFKKKLRFSQIRLPAGRTQEEEEEEEVAESNRSKRLSARKIDDVLNTSSRSKRLSARLSRNPSDEQQEQPKDDADNHENKQSEDKAEEVNDEKSSGETESANTSSSEQVSINIPDQENPSYTLAPSHNTPVQPKEVEEDKTDDVKLQSMPDKLQSSKFSDEMIQEVSSRLQSDNPSTEVQLENKTDDISSRNAPLKVQPKNASDESTRLSSDRTATNTPDKEDLWSSMNTELSSNESTDESKEDQQSSSNSKSPHKHHIYPLKSKETPKSTEKLANSHTLIIDDIIEFEVAQKASPAKLEVERSTKTPVETATTTYIRSKVESGLKSAAEIGTVFKPHKLELTEPEPIPITDPKSSKRNHASCSNKDNKISIVSSNKGSGRFTKHQAESTKIPIIAGGDDQRHTTPEKKGERDMMSDHISQLQKNQRDQSARLIAAKGVKEVVYQAAGYNQVAMMGGTPAIKPPVYMPHLPGIYGATPPFSQYYPESAHQGAVWGMPPQYASAAGSYSPAMSPRTPNMASPHQVTSSQLHVTSSPRHLVASPHHMISSPHHMMSSPQPGAMSPQMSSSQQGMPLDYHRQIARGSKSGSDSSRSPIPYPAPANSPLSCSSAHIPINSVHMPSNIVHVPSNASHIPSNASNLPSNSGHVTSNKCHVPNNTCHIPSNTCNSPSITAIIPISTCHVPNHSTNVQSNPVQALSDNVQGHVSNNNAPLTSGASSNIPCNVNHDTSNASTSNTGCNVNHGTSNASTSNTGCNVNYSTSNASTSNVNHGISSATTSNAGCNVNHGTSNASTSNAGCNVNNAPSGTDPRGASTPPLVTPDACATPVHAKKWETVKSDAGKQKSRRRDASSDNSSRKSQKRGPEEPKQVRKIVKKSGNQAEALKKISYDIYDFPVSLTNKSSRKDTENKSKESDNSEESESSAGEDANVAQQPHQLPPPYYVNYPFYPNIQNSKITNPIHQMNLITQQHHAQTRHHLYQQQQQMIQAHKQRGRKGSHRTQSPSKMRLHNQAIDANTASLLRHHHMSQQQKGAGHKAGSLPYKTPEPVASASFRGLLEAEDVPTASSPAKIEKPDGQQPQAYLSVMKLDKNKGQGPLIESYPVHGSFKSTVPRAPKLGSPKGSQPGSPGNKKTVSATQSCVLPSHQQAGPKPIYTAASPAQIHKVSNPARLPPGYDMQQQIYRYPHPIGYNQGSINPVMFKPVSTPAPPYEDTSKIVQPTLILSPKRALTSDFKPDDSISAAIQDHLTSDDLWMTDDTNFDISDLANYLDGGSNSAIPDDLIEQKIEPVKPGVVEKEVAPVVEEVKKEEIEPTVPTVPALLISEGVRKSLRERRASTKLLESGGENIISPKITVPVPSKPNTITVLPALDGPSSSKASASHSNPSPIPTSCHQRKTRTSVSETYGAATGSRRNSPPSLVRGVPTSPLKQKLKQYVLERQARQAANITPPRTLPCDSSSAHRSPGPIDNNMIQRRLSQSPSPTNWQQLIQFGRNSPNFIASLSPRSKQALFDMQCKDSRLSPYCHTSPIPSELISKREAVSPKLSSKSPKNTAKSPITNPPLFVEPKPQIKEEQIEAPPPKPQHIITSKPTVLQQTAEVKPHSGSDDRAGGLDQLKSSTESTKLSKSVPTTPEGGYNTRKIKVQTFALLGQKPKSRKSSGSSTKNSPRGSSSSSAKSPSIGEPESIKSESMKSESIKSESMKSPPKEPLKSSVIQTAPHSTISVTYPKCLGLISPEKRIPKSEALDNPFEPVFTTTASEIISPFKDSISSQHLPSSFDIHFDETELFMETEEGHAAAEEQITRPPMQADSDLTTPLVGDINLEGKDKDRLKDLGLESFDKKKSNKIGRPRSKSTISPDSADDELTKSSEIGEERRRTEPRLLLSRSVISETRASKRARSSSEPFTTNMDEDPRNRKQYYYYGEPKATKAIEPLDDHLEFKCNICKKGFPKQSRLETHLKHYHEGKENVADEESDEKEEMKISVRCTCESFHEDNLMIQCDECLKWLHSSCIGVHSANIPSQYICPLCYAIVKQLNDWYEDGNLPSLVPNSEDKPNETMLHLHSMTSEYDLISKGLTATRLKLDALERNEARRLQETKDGTWPVNGRKMEGTLVVIPGGGSVLLPNSTQTNSGDPKSSSSLVYVLSPGSAKTSTTNTIGGKTVYTVSRPPLVMSLAQLRQQNPNFRPAAVRGQLRPLSIRPTFRGVQGNQTQIKQGSVPHMVRGTTLRGMRGTARYMTNRSPLPRQPGYAPPRMTGTTRQPCSSLLRLPSSAPIRHPGSPRLPGFAPSRLPNSPRVATRMPGMRPPSPRLPLTPRLPNSPAGARMPLTSAPSTSCPGTPTRISSPRMSVNSSMVCSPRMPGGNTSLVRTRVPSRPLAPSPDSIRPIRQRSSTSPRVPSPRPSSQPGNSPRLHPKSEPATPTSYLSNSRSNSPHLAPGRIARSRPGSPRLPRSELGGRSESPRLQRADISQLIAAASNPLNSMVAKQYQDSLAMEIADSQDLLEAHISALETQLDEFKKLGGTVGGGDHSLQLGHVLYDLEQLKILTQTV